MQGLKNKKSFGHVAVLAGLWLINILIVIFSLPILIYKKLREIIFRKPKNSRLQVKDEKKSTPYFPCGINSKL